MTSNGTKLFNKRTELGLSRREFVEQYEIGYSGKALSGWEKDRAGMPQEVAIKLNKILNLDLNLGECSKRKVCQITSPFGVKLNNWRKEKGYTRNQLVKKLEISDQFLAAIYRGKNKSLPLILIKRLCNEGVDVLDWIREIKEGE